MESTQLAGGNSPRKAPLYQALAADLKAMGIEAVFGLAVFYRPRRARGALLWRPS
jgi:hypothetical protein